MALKKSEQKMLKILGVVAVLAGIAFYRIYNKSDEAPVPQVTPEVQTDSAASTTTSSASKKGAGGGRSIPSKGSGGGGGSSSSGGGSQGITTTEFEQHHATTDCWVLIKGEVYDISNFITEFQSQRDAISQFCGTFGFESGFLGENPQFTETVISSSTLRGVIK